ncbi:sensor histidine kinase [Pseudonocardia sp. MH-G8]|uniref:sensor histidine kinase n=1 Tax=Pseudonocardia sp. MH-G8 TaxID=1854588 RepID=UPI000BA0597B|nr:histidine kinase [Pseudonocardia sp. MH-G8]OZM78926.1 two-component sensor histidine kinase [Pseudonocardia sp. MH-G8]
MRVSVRPVLVDALLATVLVAVTVYTVARSGTAGAFGWPIYLFALLTAAPVAMRQRAPVLTTVIIVVALVAYGLIGHGYEEVPNGGIGLVVALFTVATLRPRGVAAVVFLPTMVVMVIVVRETEGATWAAVVQATLVLLGAWMLGDGTRGWARRTERLAAQAARAATDERVRIARELHDIVSHHMAVVSLQTGVARYVLDADPAAAAGAITAAGDAGREALAEMRRLLDVLRVDHEPDYRPQPGLAVLGELVGRTRSAGVPVDVVVTGQFRPLAPGPDLCAYRVVQEALTNVLKHAGPAAARIELDYGELTFTLTVSDDGSSSPAGPPSPESHGLRGMRERAELYGGVLIAGPRAERGFAVVLRLPLTGS